MNAKRANAITLYLLTMKYRPNQLAGGAVKVLTLRSNRVVDTNYIITEEGQKQLNDLLK